MFTSQTVRAIIRTLNLHSLLLWNPLDAQGNLQYNQIVMHTLRFYVLSLFYLVWYKTINLHFIHARQVTSQDLGQSYGCLSAVEATPKNMCDHYESNHYHDVIMGAIASQIASLTIVCSIVYSDADQRKHQSSASLAFVRAIHRGPVNSPPKWPVTRKMFPFDDVIMVEMR